MLSDERFSAELGTLSKSTTIVMIGVLFSTGFELIGRLIMARSLTQSEFGIISLGLRLLWISLFVSLVGVNIGIAPLLGASSRESDEPRFLVGAALTISVLSSLLVTVVVMLLSGPLEQVYGITHLGEVVSILAWAIIPLAMIKVITGILRGLRRFRAKVIVEDILLGCSRVILILTAVVMISGIAGISLAVVLASMCTGCVYVMYFLRDSPVGVGFHMPTTKRVLAFSLPLLWTGLVYEVTLSIDLLLLGIFMGPDIVGVYSAAATIGLFINVVVSSMIYLYIPVAAQILSTNVHKTARRLYLAASKWSLIFTFPLFATIVFYPHTILALFGMPYVDGTAALRVLGCAYFVHSLMGLGGATVISFGRPTVTSIAWTLGMVMTFFVTWALIPIWGAVGAALGTFAGLLAASIVNTGFMWRRIGIPPFSPVHLRSFIGAFVLCVSAVVIVPEPYGGFELIWLPVILASMMGLAFLGVLLARGFSREDIVLLELIEDVTHMKLRTLRSLFSKLIRQSD